MQVCLDICFEPSTTICDHRGCLQSVYQKCGTRCPKCRHEFMRATSKNDCPINTVLWNTIQFLFLQETAARLKDMKKANENCTKPVRETLSRMQQVESQRSASVARRISRPTPWRTSTTAVGTQRLGPNIAGSLAFSRRSERLRLTPRNLISFRRASEVLEIGQSPTIQLGEWMNTNRCGAGDFTSPSSHSRGSYRLRQEEEDAVLAARLLDSFLLG